MAVILICIVVASFAKALMDLSNIGALPWNPRFWDKMQGWKRKWKNGDPNQGEAFWGSSTVFVFLTDGWHLAQFLFLNGLFACLLVFDSLLHVVIYRVVFGVTFEGFYRLLKK